MENSKGNRKRKTHGSKQRQQSKRVVQMEKVSAGVDQKLLSSAVASLNRVGNDISQIAKDIKGGRHDDRARLMAGFDEIMSLVLVLEDAIGHKSQDWPD